MTTTSRKFKNVREVGSIPETKHNTSARKTGTEYIFAEVKKFSSMILIDDLSVFEVFDRFFELVISLQIRED